MTAAIRAFLALEIPEGVRSELAVAREQITKDLPGARWTRANGWHLTLKFLGETESETLEKLIRELEPRVSGLGAVGVHLGGGGFFPSGKRPRVAWIGGAAEGAGPVVDAVERAAVRAGFPRERRSWALHLTMARLKKPWPSDAVRRFIGWAEALEIRSFRCPEAIVYSSRLEPGGAVYTALERMSLE